MKRPPNRLHALLTIVAAAVLILTGSMIASAESSGKKPEEQRTSVATSYPLPAGPSPDYFSCSEWTPWYYTGRPYCQGWVPQCWNWKDSATGEYQDQYRYRTCSDVQTGESYREYDFRTAYKGCCVGIW